VEAPCSCLLRDMVNFLRAVAQNSDHLNRVNMHENLSMAGRRVVSHFCTLCAAKRHPLSARRGELADLRAGLILTRLARHSEPTATGFEEVVHHPDHARAFSDRRRDALDRPAAGVADCEDPGDRRLKRLPVGAG
jgi:hypothetical protein